MSWDIDERARELIKRFYPFRSVDGNLLLLPASRPLFHLYQYRQYLVLYNHLPIFYKLKCGYLTFCHTHTHITAVKLATLTFSCFCDTATIDATSGMEPVLDRKAVIERKPTKHPDFKDEWTFLICYFHW